MAESERSFRKDLLHPGRGDIPFFQKNTKAIFHFRSYKFQLDGESILGPSPEDIIDDTRKMGNGPFELLIGREFKLDVWDEMVKTMKLSEVARFVCPFKRIINYPQISKALRAMSLRNAGKEVPVQSHQCSFTAMQTGTGHPELDRILTDMSPLCFEVELVAVEQPGDYQKDHWAMTDHEKTVAISALREEGNALYKQGNHDGASGKYFEALSYLEEQIIKEKPQSDEWYAIANLKVPLLLNYAQCKLLEEEYAEVIRHTTSVLEIDPGNIKALYRRGRAHSASWDVHGATLDLRRAVELDASLGSAVEKELRTLTQRVKEKDAAERERLRGKLFT